MVIYICRDNGDRVCNKGKIYTRPTSILELFSQYFWKARKDLNWLHLYPAFTQISRSVVRCVSNNRLFKKVGDFKTNLWETYKRARLCTYFELLTNGINLWPTYVLSFSSSKESSQEINFLHSVFFVHR